MLMDSSHRRLSCHVGNLPALAIADSGADIDLVSLQYAQDRMWDITPLPSDEGFVLLANEGLVKLAGYVDTDLTVQGKSMNRRFYVLDNLWSNVVLGDETIEEFQIFGDDKAFLDVGDYEANTPFCAVQCIEKLSELEKDVDEILDNIDNDTGVPAPVPSTTNKSFIPTWRKKAKPSPEDTKAELLSRLFDLDRAKRAEEAQASLQRVGLSGEALRVAEEVALKDKEEYNQLRQKILSKAAKLTQ
ncbi:hypothetical protein PG987_000560 [Apiospora arundinis]